MPIPPTDESAGFLGTFFIEMMRKECSDHSRGPKPLCVVPQYDVQIYSRALACRMDENGKLLSIGKEDVEIICRYFAE